MNKLDIVQFGLRRFVLPFRIRHLHGPRQTGGGPDDVIVISVVRNGEPWLESFLSHHRAIGIRNFVILDNGSTDRTVELLSAQLDVTVLKTLAPYHAYENTMKRYLARKYCNGRWCLCVDVDELFDFPHSARMTLSSFIGYLKNKRYDAVVTQMLDMFSDRPISDVNNDGSSDLRKQYSFYDLSDIEKSRYAHGELPNSAIAMHRGGIRKAVFGTNNGLTKVSLFLMSRRIKPFVVWHHVMNARLADVSCVLLHFPFAGAFYAKVAEAVETGRYGYLTTDEYGAYLARLGAAPTLCLKRESAKALSDVDELLSNGFLVESADYRKWAADQMQKAG